MNEAEALQALKTEAVQLGEMNAKLPADELESRELILRRLKEIETALRSAGGALPAQNAPTFEQFKAFAERIAHVIVERTARLSKRLAALEKKVGELAVKSGGITITADNVSVPMTDVAQAVADLSATLSRPVLPIFDDKGMLSGVVRADSDGEVPGAPQMKALPLIAGLETRVNWIEATLAEKKRDEESFERRLSLHAEHLARLEDRMRKAEGKA